MNRASLETADYSGWTPFFHAVACDQYETARTLHLAGADMARRDKRGKSALMVVVETGNRDMLDLLMSAIISDDDFVPGVRNAHTDKLAEMAVKRLVAFVGGTDDEGNNALHCESSRGSIECDYGTTSTMLSQQQQQNFISTLPDCAKFGREAFAYELAHEVGIHAEVFNHAKETPAELAKSLGQHRIAKIFDDQIHSLKTVSRAFVRESIFKVQTDTGPSGRYPADVGHGKK